MTGRCQNNNIKRLLIFILSATRSTFCIDFKCCSVFYRNAVFKGISVVPCSSVRNTRYSGTHPCRLHWRQQKAENRGGVWAVWVHHGHGWGDGVSPLWPPRGIVWPTVFDPINFNPLFWPYFNPFYFDISKTSIILAIFRQIHSSSGTREQTLTVLYLFIYFSISIRLDLIFCSCLGSSVERWKTGLFGMFI